MNKVRLQKIQKNESQKQICSTIPLLSELYIELPKPQSMRSMSNSNCHQQCLAADYSPNYRLEGERLTMNESSTKEAKGEGSQQFFKLSKLKSSSASPNTRSQAQIILQWIKNIFQKKKLLGPHWEQKIKKKQRNLVKEAFGRLKEEIKSNSVAYLQTQSKHRPLFLKQNHMIVLGIQKLKEITSGMVLKSKRTAFSKILRYLAFHHKLTPNSKLESLAFGESFSPTLNESKDIRNTSPQMTQFIKSIEVLSPKQEAKRNYDRNTKVVEIKTPVKQVQSPANLIFADNEYSLTPASAKQWTDHKRVRKQDSQSVMSKNSEKSKLNRELMDSRSQPHHITIGGIGGNFKYEFNQHNYIVVQPQNLPFPLQNQKGNEQFQSTNPPSPVVHQLRPNITFFNQQSKQANLQSIPIVFSPQIHQICRDNTLMRDSNYVRPHSHNPFTAEPNQNHSSSQRNTQQRDNSQTRKSRTISASGNIKICFKSKEEAMKAEAKRKENDYQSQAQLKQQNIHKLGTTQNKKMRQNYQISSYGNELLVQDYLTVPQSPNYIYSNPISPKPQEILPKNILSSYPNTNPLSPSTPTIHSPRNLPQQPQKAAHLPQLREQNQKPKQSVQSSTASRKPQREKLMVTSAQSKTRAS